MYKFSPSRALFYPAASLGIYKDLPSDLIDATKATRQEFSSANQPEGKVLGSANGLPAWIDAPEPKPLTTDQKIAALESSITPRNIRGYLIGDQYAIDHIKSVDDQIAELRAK